MGPWVEARSEPEGDPSADVDRGPAASGPPSSDPSSGSPGASPEVPSSGTAAPASQPHVKPSYALLAVVSLLSAAADLASKWWAKATLVGADPVTGGQKRFIVIENFFDFVYAENPGGAWSMLRGLPEIVRRPFFLVVSSVAIVFIISIYARIDRRQRALVWGLPLALGGAIGNLVDRMRYGYVVDFIHVWMKRGEGNEYHWPTFNVADVAIVLGVGLMASDLFFSRKHHAEPASEAPGDPPLADPPEADAAPELVGPEGGDRSRTI